MYRQTNLAHCALYTNKELLRHDSEVTDHQQKCSVQVASGSCTMEPFEIGDIVLGRVFYDVPSTKDGGYDALLDDRDV